MRIIFAGRDNPFNRGIINWLSKDHDVVAAFFLEPGRHSLKAKLKRLRKRVKRYSIFKVIDEILFHVYYKVIMGWNEKKKIAGFPNEFIEKSEISCEEYEVPNINSEKWIKMIKDYDADLIFSVCSAVIFKKELYNAPKYGTLVLHEGLTPEYKGLHTPLWALMKNEYEFIGYTLLRVNDEIDGGKIISQRKYTLKEDEDFKVWSFVAHYAIVDGLETMKSDLSLYEKMNENFEYLPIAQDRKSGYYTWMGLTQFIRLYLKNHFRARSKI